MQNPSEAIVVRPDNRVAKAAWNACCLIFWVGAAIDMTSRPSAEVVPTTVLAIAGTVWSVAFALIAANLIWILWGQQVAKVSGDQLECFYSLGEILLWKKRSYRVSDIGDMQREIKSYRAKGGAFTRSDITFSVRNSGAREVLFKYISDTQADDLLSGALKPFSRKLE